MGKILGLDLGTNSLWCAVVDTMYNKEARQIAELPIFSIKPQPQSNSIHKKTIAMGVF